MPNFYVNTASKAQLASGITSGATSVTLASFTGWPVQYPYYGIINRGNGSAEIVKVTSAAGSTLTITRAQGGTLASAHSGGEFFEHIAPADAFNDFETHMAATAAHGATGAVVGTTGAQTIQDKEYRGHYTHAFADALPAGSAAGFEVTASSAIARDGFKVSNTGADTARRAFLLEQSGSARFEVFQDGTGKLRPNTAHTRPALETNVGAAKSGLRVTNADASDVTTFQVLGTGAVTSNGITNNTNGIVNAGGIINSTGGIASTGTFTNTGNADINGTLHATGAVDFDSTLNVDGASNLVGLLTMTLPSAGGAHSRILSNARTGTDNYFEGKRSDASTRFVIESTGRTKSWDYLMAYDGSQPAAVSVSSTAVVPSPVTGTVVFDESDRLLKRYNGSTWDVVGPGYGGNTKHQVEYVRTTTQSIANASLVKANFTTSEQTDTSIVTVAGGTDFTLVRAGVYEIEANIPWASSDGSGSRWALIGKTSDTNVRYATVNNGNPGSPACHMQVSRRRRFAAGEVISVFVFQDKTAGALNLDPQTATGPMNISIAWVGP